LLARFFASAGPTSKAFQTLSSPIAGAPEETMNCLLLLQTGVIALLTTLGLAICVYTTDNLSLGSRAADKNGAINS
jgi:hypothetical protein